MRLNWVLLFVLLASFVSAQQYSVYLHNGTPTIAPVNTQLNASVTSMTLPLATPTFIANLSLNIATPTCIRQVGGGVIPTPCPPVEYRLLLPGRNITQALPQLSGTAHYNYTVNDILTEINISIGGWLALPGVQVPYAFVVNTINWTGGAFAQLSEDVNTLTNTLGHDFGTAGQHLSFTPLRVQAEPYVLAWFGNDTTTKQTNNLNDHVYACMDFDNNSQCDLAPARWIPAAIKHSWDRKSVGFCQRQEQCMIRASFNESLDDQPDLYWSGTLSRKRPKCITNGQYIEDYYCEKGEWSTRTKKVATQLVAIALDRSPDNFTLFCDDLTTTLNRYEYANQFGIVNQYLKGIPRCLQPGGNRRADCVNNVCVLSYSGGVALGMSMNTAINGSNSPLQAFNKSVTHCNGALTPAGQYNSCGDNLWYKDSDQSLLYAPGIASLPAITPLVQDFYMTPYNKINNYTDTLAQSPLYAGYNYTAFTYTPLFDQIYMSKDILDFVYSYKQDNITLNQLTYAGWYYSNIDLAQNVCQRIILQRDQTAACDYYTGSRELYVAAQQAPAAYGVHDSLTNEWVDLTGVIRIQ